MSNWTELRFHCPIPLTDIVSGELWELGCQGLTEGPTVHERVLLQVSFENLNPSEQKRIERACSQVFSQAQQSVPPFEWKPIQLENWKETHRRFYPPQPLSSRFFLVPAWQVGEVEVPKGYDSIIMEPGRAFGTGLHQSTRLALWLTEEYLTQASEELRKILDVGTGSGILAMAARKLGSFEVYGTDIDPEAIEVAIENCTLNNVPDIRLSTNSLDSFSEQEFDLVISNILLRTHSELLAGYSRVVKKGGVLILSGLLTDQVLTIEPRLVACGFARNRSKVIDEWESVAYIRREVVNPN